MRFLAVLLTAALVLYPVLVYMGSQWLEPRYLGLLALAAYVLRGLFLARSRKLAFLTAGGGIALAATVWWLNSAKLLLLVPALINVVLAAIFGWSLYRPPTIPARVAMKLEGDLSPAKEHYTTQVTRLWLSFFCLNGAIAAATALWASEELWLLYNGVIAYGLIGVLFAGEYAYRHLVVKRRS